MKSLLRKLLSPFEEIARRRAERLAKSREFTIRVLSHEPLEVEAYAPESHHTRFLYRHYYLATEHDGVGRLGVWRKIAEFAGSTLELCDETDLNCKRAAAWKF
jgi:hypothetical protein